MSKIIEVRRAVKAVIVNKGGLTGYDVNAIKAALKCNCVDVQNAINYFQFSPQQKTFREMYDFY